MTASHVPSTAIEEYYQLYLLLHTPAEAIMMPTTGKRSKTSNDEFSSTNATQTTRLIVPTVTNKNKTEELDLHFMTEEELKMLQKKDPFLYYSIPAIREAALSLKEVDYSEVSQSAHKVTRKTRLSFENHTQLVTDELFGNELDGLEESDLGELDDMLATLFFNTQ